MSRGNYKFDSNHEYETSDNLPDWLSRFADEYDNKQTTAVEVARQRQEPVSDRIHSIMNGYTPKRSPYNSVSEAVSDYQKRTGLADFQKAILANQIVTAAEEEEAEKKSPEDSRPSLLDRNPAIDSYIHNVIDTNHCVQIPAVLHSILETFKRDVNESDLDDPELARYINKLLAKRVQHKDNHDAVLGRDVGIREEDLGRIDNPFQALMPSRRW